MKKLFSCRSRASRQSRASPPKNQRCTLEMEFLEDRRLLSGTVIGGYVYVDANKNNLFDFGETRVPGSTILLKKGDNQFIASTATNADGYYEFTKDPTISTAPATLSKSISFPNTPTNFAHSGVIDQFDSDLGTLQSVQIIHDGSITSEIKVENTSTSSPSTITGTVSGTLTLNGPGVNQALNLSQNAGTITVGAFDTVLDFAGTSGMSFGPKTAAGNNVFTVTGAAMAPYIGKGQVAFSESGTATSSASGGGNIVVTIISSGSANVTVVYTYLPIDDLRPGPYILEQRPQPAGLLDGQESRNGVVLTNAPGVDIIELPTFTGVAPLNNFGELVPPNLSGFVYVDNNNNGLKDQGEEGIPGVAIAFTGASDAGAVNMLAATDANGFYQFLNLRPGFYTVQETQPAGFFDGMDTAGSTGGSAGNDVISSIPLAGGDQSVNNNFGELRGSVLSGHVYVDTNNNGIKEAGELPISGATVTLAGGSAAGAVNQITTTDADGFYKFINLQAGTYTLHEAQPTSYLDGKDAIGSQGGQVSNDQFTNVVLPIGVVGINNNFGELKVSGLSGYVFVDANNNGFRDLGESSIPGVTVALTGSDDFGAVSKTASSDATGYFEFLNLRPGTYTLNETQPSTYLDGKDALGTLAGTFANDLFSAIAVNQLLGTDYDYGELVPGSLSGFVYADKNKNGTKDTGDGPISVVQVILSGSDDLGGVNRTANTDAAGFYQFKNLRPGTYTITETQPANFKDNQDNVGSLGGDTTNDQFFGIVLAMAAQGVEYNFGEIILSADVGIVKAVNFSQVIVGDNLTYTLTITNHGENVASQVVVKDTLPPTVTFVSASAPGWAVSRTGNTLTAAMPSLAVNASAIITITVRAPLVTGLLVNNTTVTAITPDDNPTNNHASATTLVINQPGTLFPNVITPLQPAFHYTPLRGKGVLILQSRGTLPWNLKGPAVFIDGLYRSLTGKGLSAPAILNHIMRMQAGKLTAEQLVDTLWKSTAHRTMQANALYQTFFHRLPTVSERTATIRALNAGMPEEQLAVQLMTSTQYLQTHPSATALVTGFYQDVQGMVPDLASLLATAEALDAQTWSGFVQASMTANETLAQIVDAAYRGTVRRPATDVEIQSGIAQLQSGQITSAQLVKNLLISDEFRQLTVSLAR